VSNRPVERLCGRAEHGKRSVLHVQSISAWAPACIGPYAQAAAWGGVLHMAGQIGLDPASMQVVAGGAAAQARPRPPPRCLRHASSARGLPHRNSPLP